MYCHRIFTSVKTSNHARMREMETGNKLNTYDEDSFICLLSLLKRTWAGCLRVYLCVSAFKILKQVTYIHETQQEQCGTEGHFSTLL